MSSLPIDVIETILLGVPALDLVRCKRVCEAWRSLISSADFAAAHFQRSKSEPSSHQLLVLNRSFGFRRPVAGPFASFICLSTEDLIIVGSVNGLICIAGKGDKPGLTLTPDDLWILNPLTGLSYKLPYSRVTFDLHFNIKFAFWCDDDGVYKVAKILVYYGGKTVLELWVSTSSDTWSTVPTFRLSLPIHHRRLHACDVVIEGLAAYWICVNCHEIVTVISLDLKTLALVKFIPRKIYRRSDSYSLWGARIGDPNFFLFGGNLNGEFVLVEYSFSSYGLYHDVWTPSKTGWIKKFTICFDSFPFEKCLGIVNDKLVLTSCGDTVIDLYDPLTGILEVLETDYKLETLDVGYARGFVGSLVSIDGFGFESNDLLRTVMDISWPHSLYPSNLKGRRNTCKRQRRSSDSDFLY